MLLTSPLLDALPGIRHGFSTRQGGVSVGPYASLNFGGDDQTKALAENRRRFNEALGLAGGSSVVTARQVHGSRLVDSGVIDADTEADALATSRTNVAIGIRTADCAPILMAGIDAHGAPHIAAVHAGWRGAAANIAAVAVAALASRGVRADQQRIAIGPTIGMRAFEVGDEVIAAARRALSGDAPKTFVNERGRHHLSLVDLIRRLFLRAGIAPSNIDLVGGCTHEDATMYFSHRRDLGKTGRHLSAIVISDGAAAS